jgi:hypothetical protein
VVSPLNHAKDLMGWCYLWEGLTPDGSFGAVTGAELERAARDFAARWLAARPCWSSAETRCMKHPNNVAAGSHTLAAAGHRER